MIARGCERDPSAGRGGGYLLRPVDQPGLLPREQEAGVPERSAELPEGGLPGTALWGEHPEVVHPPKVPSPHGAKGVVGGGEHRVGEHRGRVRPDGQAGDAGQGHGLEDGDHVVDVAPLAAHPSERLSDELGPDGRIAPVDVGHEQRPRGCRHPAGRHEEPGPGAPPGLEAEERRAGAGQGHPIGHDLVAESTLDERSDPSHRGRVRARRGGVEDREPPDAARLGCRDETRRGGNAASEHPLLSPARERMGRVFGRTVCTGAGRFPQSAGGG